MAIVILPQPSIRPLVEPGNVFYGHGKQSGRSIHGGIVRSTLSGMLLIVIGTDVKIEL